MVDSYIAKHWSPVHKITALYTGGDIYTSNDGAHLYSLCNNKINIIEICTTTLLSVISMENEDIICFAVSHNQKNILCFTKANLYRLWNIEDPKKPQLIMYFKLPYNCIALCLDIYQSGSLVGCGCSDRTVKVFDLNKKICTHNFTGHKAIVVKVCFHPDAAKMQLVSCSEDSTVKVWDLVMKQCLHSFNHGSVITDFAFHPKLNLLYVNEINFKVHVYDLSDFNRVAAIKLDKNSSCLAVMKQNKETMLFLGSEDGTISVVDANSHKLVNTIESISQQYTKLIYVSNTHTLLAVTKDQNILLYDANNIENKYTHAIVGFLDEVTDIAYAITETNRYIVVSTNSEILKIFDEADPSQVSFLVGHKEIIMCLSSFKHYVASGSKDFTVKLWKISSLSEHICIGTFTGHTEVISCICLFPKQGHKLVSASQDKTLKVWDCHELLDQDDNIQINSSLFTQVAHEKAINSIKVSPNEAIIATSSQDKTIKLWNAKTYQLLSSMKEHKRGVWDIEFSPVEKLLASAGGDGLIKIWNIDTFQCVKTLEKHDLSALKVRWISKGTQLVSNSADGVTKIWHMKKSECIQSYSHHDGKLWALQTDPSNNEIITGGTDSTVIIWKDVTKETIEEENEVNRQMIQDQQSITSLMLCKEYADATKAAFKIGKRKECLLLIEKMAFGSAEGDSGIDCIDFILNHKDGNSELKLDGVKNTIKELKCINLKELIDIAKEYIVHIRYYKVSELIINCILESISKQDIVALGKLEFDSKKGDIGFYKIMDMMGEYSSKHLDRVRRQIQKAHVLKMVSQQLGISKSLE